MQVKLGRWDSGAAWVSEACDTVQHLSLSMCTPEEERKRSVRVDELEGQSPSDDDEMRRLLKEQHGNLKEVRREEESCVGWRVRA